MDTPVKDAEARPTFPSLRSSDSSLAHVEAFENGYPPCLCPEGAPSPHDVLTNSRYLLQVFQVLSHALLLAEGLCRHKIIKCMCFS